MGFFSKKITTDKIAESLEGFFDSMVAGFKNSFKSKNILINERQEKEILIISIFTIVHATIIAFGKTPKIATDTIAKFQFGVINKYFKEMDEIKQFRELLQEKSDDYSKILNNKDKDLATKIGQVFCSHFFGKEEDGSHLEIMMLTGGISITIMIETKKFLDEVLSKYKII